MEQKYGKIFMIILAVTVILLVISLITLGVALAVTGGGDKEGDPAPAPDSSEGDAPAGTTTGGVATLPTRSSYLVGDSSSYATPHDITSKYVILVDMESYEAIAGVRADTKICPASMTKVMTLLVACENLRSLNDTVTVSKESVNYRKEHDGSGLDWKGGEVLRVEDLLYLVFCRSDTVASLELANYIAGSEAAFVDMMNAKVDALGLQNTRFANATGLYFSGQEYYSTCREIAAIMAYAMDNPLAKKVMTQTGDWYLPSGSPVKSIKPTWLTDRFGGKAGLNTVTIQAAKTGWETSPGACLVSYATGNETGKAYIMVVVGGNGLSATQNTKDVKSVYQEFAR